MDLQILYYTLKYKITSIIVVFTAVSRCHYVRLASLLNIILSRSSHGWRSLKADGAGYGTWDTGCIYPYLPAFCMLTFYMHYQHSLCCSVISYIIICATIPAVKNETIKLPSQIARGFFQVLSLNITITAAMHGTNRVMAINDINTCEGLSNPPDTMSLSPAAPKSLRIIPIIKATDVSLEVLENLLL